MRNARGRNRLRVQPWERGQDHDGILPGLEAMREADGADLTEQPECIGGIPVLDEYCDGCGALRAIVAKSPNGALLCDDCAKGPDDDPILSPEIVAAIGKKIDAGTFTALDATLLYCHAQAVTVQYTEFVQRVEQGNNQAQIVLFHKEEEIHRLRVALGKIRSAIALAKSKAPHGMSWIDGLTMIEQAAHETHPTDER